MENKDQTKTFLTVIFRSIAGSCEDVIAMIPLDKCLDEIGYQVIVSLVDGHSSNVKFY